MTFFLLLVNLWASTTMMTTMSAASAVPSTATYYSRRQQGTQSEACDSGHRCDNLQMRWDGPSNKDERGGNNAVKTVT
jgi:hypothetical protein